MNKETVITQALEWFDSGAFKDQLAQRVALPTESQIPGHGSELQEYLDNHVGPVLQHMGFEIEQVTLDSVPDQRFMIARYHESDDLPCILCYGHGDVVSGNPEQWRQGLSPWLLTEEKGNWYGRGTADNKGQHSINIAALEQVYRARNGRLGFNCTWLFEMGEEISSPGLNGICEQYKEKLTADMLIASDGPRVSVSRPTLFLGSRGTANIRLTINARNADYHSGNWGGVLSNPGIRLCNAIAALVDQNGVLQLDALKPSSLPDVVKQALSDIDVGNNPGDPELSDGWGEPGLSAAERLYGWNNLEVLAFSAGNSESPVNAIPGKATAVCQLRFVVGTNSEELVQNVRQYLQMKGFDDVDVVLLRGSPATRLDPDDPLVKWALSLISEVTHKHPALLPNFGGSLPNHVFSETLGLPTLWIPHSYPACGQHAANEHLPRSIAREGLAIMTAVFWQLGEEGKAVVAAHLEQKEGDANDRA